MTKKEDKKRSSGQSSYLQKGSLCKVIPPEGDSLVFKKSSFAINPMLGNIFDIFPWVLYL